MGKPDLTGYIDVPERIRQFKAKFPDGCLQGEGFFVRKDGVDEGEIVGYHYKAFAHRSPDDECPGVGTAYEQIPGRTPYTKDSEVMNAETSAWGRAIAALGFDFGSIASKEEVRRAQSIREQKPERGGLRHGADDRDDADAAFDGGDSII